MITYLFPVTCVKKISLQCYRLYNFPFFRSSHWRYSVRKRVLRNFAKFIGKHSFSIKLQAEANASDLSRDLSWRFLISFQQKNETKKGKYRDGVQIFTSFARVSICLTLKISKEISNMVIWSENVFKENFMLQFSWLEEFR